MVSASSVIDDEVAFLRVRPVEQIDHPRDHGLPAVAFWIGPLWAAATRKMRGNDSSCNGNDGSAAGSVTAMPAPASI